MQSLTALDLQRLHTAYADGVFRYFWTATGHVTDAEDLVQEFFVKLATHGRAILTAQIERAWIFTVARKLTLDWHRRHQRRPQCDASADPTDLILTTTEDPDAALLGNELLLALASLPPDQRVVAELRLWEGLSLREIAESQSIPLQTVASRLRYALDKLRSKLQHLYSEIS